MSLDNWTELNILWQFWLKFILIIKLVNLTLLSCSSICGVNLEFCLSSFSVTVFRCMDSLNVCFSNHKVRLAQEYHCRQILAWIGTVLDRFIHKYPFFKSRIWVNYCYLKYTVHGIWVQAIFDILYLQSSNEDAF